jgi:hypothetical protein
MNSKKTILLFLSGITLVFCLAFFLYFSEKSQKEKPLTVLKIGIFPDESRKKLLELTLSRCNF